jgi:hypothetical protein
MNIGKENLDGRNKKSRFHANASRKRDDSFASRYRALPKLPSRNNVRVMK